jgi:XTP/dITP diphosphohydrolase
MRRLIFATNNKHKLTEVRAALSNVKDIEIVSLAEAGLEGEIPETADTLEGNAQQKAEWVIEQLKVKSEKLRVDGVFADDTGLEVEALGGAPGVYSARYAGEHCSFDDNIDKLLGALDGEKNRKACFRTVICLIEGGKEIRREGEEVVSFFEGRVDGQILTERHSNGEGFGYDPVFMPDRFAVSFAEMPLEVKNSISHRGLAVKKLAEYLVTVKV